MYEVTHYYRKEEHREMNGQNWERNGWSCEIGEVLVRKWIIKKSRAKTKRWKFGESILIRSEITTEKVYW